MPGTLAHGTEANQLSEHTARHRPEGRRIAPDFNGCKDRDGRPESAKQVIKVIDRVLARLAPANHGKTVPLPKILPAVLRKESPTLDEPIEIGRKLPPWAIGLMGGLVVGVLLGWLLISAGP